MHAPLLVLSGPIASGKSTLAKELELRHQALNVTTRDPLNKASRSPRPGRQELQDAGTHLDETTNGAWVVNHLKDKLLNTPGVSLVVLDCIRNSTQLAPIIHNWDAPMLHMHLTAPTDILTQRYIKRGDKLPHTQALHHPAERGIADLALSADVVVDTSQMTPTQIAELAMTRLRAAAPLKQDHAQTDPHF